MDELKAGLELWVCWLLILKIMLFIGQRITQRGRPYQRLPLRRQGVGEGLPSSSITFCLLSLQLSYQPLGQFWQVQLEQHLMMKHLQS